MPEDAGTDPAAFVAVTTTFTVRFSSPSSVSVGFVAPAMSLHSVLSRLQDCHWYVNVGGVPVQVPVPAVSSWPSLRIPVIVGTAVFTSGIAATRPVAADVAEAEPAEFVAVTTTLSVVPTSGGASFRV